MRVRNLVLLLVSASWLVIATAGSAFAGGMPQPPPDRAGPWIAASLCVLGSLLAAGVASGVVQRRDRR